MAYTCNMKGLEEKYILLSVVDQDRPKSATAVEHSRKFKGMQSIANPRLCARGNYCLSLRKRKVKNKKLSKLLL